MTYKERLQAIRQQMKAAGIDAYIIPSSDPHISEYLPDRYKCIAWSCGFTGSAGTLAITQEFAGLWTDSRYFVQAADQLRDTGFELVKLKAQTAAEYADWLAKQLPAGSVVAFDGKLASIALAKSVQQALLPAGISVNGHVDILENIWIDRPALPTAEAYLIEERTTGESVESKIGRVREQLAANQVDAHLVSSLDDLAWILNIRGNDVKCNPVVLGFLLIEKERCTLYIDRAKLHQRDQNTLQAAGISLSSYDEAFEALRSIDAKRIWIDPKRTCFTVFDSIGDATEVLELINPSTRLKAVKNTTEISHTRGAMVKDGIALTKFFKWVEEHVESGKLTEISIADKLQDLRAQSAGFVDISFDTIAGYLAHGALPHYKATAQSDATLKATGLLLVDSGGQYHDGTTDITRVVSLGEITAAEKVDYTLVLKGMIDGSTCVFPIGTRGYQIDAITRRPLWEQMRNYGHGTGHGVGFFLNVHEGPQVLNPSNIDIPVEPGMITSIEPGLYREGEYGIRIENLVLSKVAGENQFGEFLDFETLTLCYIATDLVDKSMLEDKHIIWLNGYNAWVLEKLGPFLDQRDRDWLAEKTAAI